VTDSLVWISGGTAGLGSGFINTVPYETARIVNLARREAPGVDNVHLDLADEKTWDATVRSFNDELSEFTGTRAIFVHNAFLAADPSFVGEGLRGDRQRELFANFNAGIFLCDAFIEAVLTHRANIESGVVVLSSAAARIPWEGQSAYCAVKAGFEQWVRVVRRERKMRGVGPWVTAVRPGFVDTPGARAAASFGADVYPIGPSIAAAFERGEGVLTPDEAARDIWKMLPDGGPRESVLLFGAPPEGAQSASKV
jgi:benzil reductase ((S)-benzoin forming)